MASRRSTTELPPRVSNINYTKFLPNIYAFEILQKLYFIIIIIMKKNNLYNNHNYPLTINKSSSSTLIELIVEGLLQIL